MDETLAAPWGLILAQTLAATMLLVWCLWVLGLGGRHRGSAAGKAPERRRRRLLAGIFLAVALALSLLGHAFYQYQSGRILAQQHAALAQWAQLKAVQVSQWMTERRGDAQMLAQDPMLRQVVSEWLAQGLPDNALRDLIFLRLQSVRHSYSYRSVELRDAAGGVLLSVGPTGRLTDHELAIMAGALAEDRLKLMDLQPDPDGEAGSRLHLVAPVHLTALAAPDDALALVLRIDPADHLYRLMQHFRRQSETAETVLVTLAGDQTLFLSPLRHRAADPAPRQLPLERPGRQVSLPAPGRPGLVMGTDYRGMPVLAAIEPVAGTPWSVVAKIDTREIEAPVRRLASGVAAVVLLFMGLSIAAAALWWRQQRALLLADTARSDLERRLLARQFDYLARHANDLIILADDLGLITEANERTLEILGYTGSELLGQPLELIFEGDTGIVPMPEAGAGGQSGRVFETRLRRRDGSLLPVEASVRAIQVDGHRFHQAILRDITERKEAEARIRRLTHMYSVVSETNQAIARIHDRDTMLHALCRIAVEHGELRTAWIGLVNPETRRIEPLATHSPVADFFDGLVISADPDLPEGRGPAGIAVRERRCYIANDYLNDPATLPWRERAAQLDVRSCAAFPILLAGEARGVLHLSAAEVGYFDPEMTALVEKLAEDVGFALEMFEREAQRRETEAQLEHILDVGPTATYVLSPRRVADGGYQVRFMSHNIERLTGYPPEKWLHDPMLWVNALHPEDREAALKRQEQLLLQGHLNHEYRFRRKDGGYAWINDSLRLVRGADGRVEEIIGTWVDVTERRQGEQLLRSLAEITAGLTGREFFEVLVEQIARAFGVRYAFIGRLDAEDPDLVHSVALWADGRLAPCPSYRLHGTPCESVVGKRACLYPENVQAQFPEDGMLAEMGVESYLGAPLFGPNGAPLGLLSVLDDKPMPADEFKQLVLAIFAARAGAEMERLRTEEALREGEQRYRQMFESNPTPMLVYDLETLRFLAVNDAATRHYGYDRGEFLELSITDIRPADDLAALLANVGRTPEAMQETRVWRHLRKDGSLMQVEITSHIINFGGRKAVLMLALDVTERRRAEEQMRLTSRVFESSREAIMVTDRDLRIVSVNRAFSEITGYSAEEAIGRTPAILHSGRHEPAFYRAMWKDIEHDGHWQGEIWNRRKSGEIYPQWISISKVLDSNGRLTHYVSLASDITEFKQAQERIHYLAHYDALTDLPNRMLFNDRANQALATATRGGHELALLFLDLDRFKLINDSLGHDIGDQLLQAVAARLVAAGRKIDTVSRHGGDEFLLMLPETGADGASHVAVKLLENLAQPFDIAGHQLTVTPSIGIAVFPHDGSDVETLIRNADVAMYHAKDLGRNNYQFFTADMNAVASERLSIENSLHRALERGEFLLHYQPQVEMDSGRIVGLEALLRWRTEGGVSIPPGKFIPVAEDSGLIIPIGEWVLREACRQAAEWQRQGLPAMPVAVNLSALQFRQRSLPQTVARVLAETGLAPGYLELELTESIIMHEAEATRLAVDELHALGIKLAIDDFGTGYSSLVYLRRFPIDRLKIDQSFVRDIATDSDDAAIVQAVITLAHSLRIAVVAEGVEDQAQYGFLQDSGCDQAQGYFLCRPMSAARIQALLRAEGGHIGHKAHSAIQQPLPFSSMGSE